MTQADTSISSAKTNIPPPDLRRNDIRTIICVAAAGTVTASSSVTDLGIFDGLVILFAFAYTLASYIFLRRVKAERYEKLLDQTTMVDAAIIGFILSYVQFNMIPTLLFIVMIQFNSLIQGGLKKCGQDNLAFIAGVAITFIFWQPQWRFASNVSVSVASLVGVFAYFFAYALHLNLHMRKLETRCTKLGNEQTLHKLRTYKLSRYVSPTVWKAVNEGREDSLKTERKRVTLFFSDIQGFSSLSEELEAETITGLLNSYLSEMIKIVTHHKGTIDKFMGDGVMVIFGDAQSEGVKQDCVRCVSMAIDMRKKMKELQTVWYNQGFKKPLRIRMGINTGYCTVGTFGASHYKDYTAVGAHANLASRLESSAEPGEILISHETWSLIKDTILCRDKGEITVKGFSHPIKVYQVVDFRKDLGKNQSYFEENTEGFSMHLDLDKIKNYDKARILKSLENVVERINDKIL